MKSNLLKTDHPIKMHAFTTFLHTSIVPFDKGLPNLLKQKINIAKRGTHMYSIHNLIIPKETYKNIMPEGEIKR